MASYLTTIDAELRLDDRYGITATISQGDIDAASDELDSMMPFVGYRYSTDTDVQTRQFPRATTLDGDTEGEVPPRILDWVALRAYQLATDEGPAVTSEGAGGVSVSYANPKVSQTEKRMMGLLSPYLRRVGVRF